MKRATILFLTAAAAILPSAPIHAERAHGAHRGAATAVPAELLALLQSNPTGGDELSNGVFDALTNDPAIAPAVVALAALGNPEQKASIAIGALRAISQLQTTNPAGAATINAALNGGDPVFSAIVAGLRSGAYANNNQNKGHGGLLFYPGTGGFSSGGGGGSDVVSPH